MKLGIPILTMFALVTSCGTDHVEPQADFASIDRPSTATPSAVRGAYCGGEAQDTVGRPLDLNAECRRLHGSSASAALARQDAYGWVCRRRGQADVGLNMHQACRASYGEHATASLIGIEAYDWRCLSPSDVDARVVPVLLVPVDRVGAPGEAAAVKAALLRVEALVKGVRKFYRDKSGRVVRGTNAFVQLTSRSAADWQSLAIATDHANGAYPLDRYAYLEEAREALKTDRWNVLASRSSVRIGMFTYLGAAPSSPTGYGAAARDSFFVEPPSVSYASCDPGQNNSAAYEKAFYATGHELGHTMGLPHTDEYDFDRSMPQPANWRDSIMYTGQGTASLLFDFEVSKLRSFLDAWSE